MRRDDEIGHVVAYRLVGPVAERRLGGVVPVENQAAVIHDDHRVERGLEHRAEAGFARANLGLGVTADDELPHLAADHAHRLEQHVVGLAQIAGEELDGADDAARSEQREAERRLQPGAAGSVRAREVAVARAVDDPTRPAGDEQAAGEPLARVERQALTQGFELGRAVAGVPRADAAQPPVVRANFPDCTELPAERASDGLERRCVSLDRSFGMREDLGDVVLDALQALRVNYGFHAHR